MDPNKLEDDFDDIDVIDNDSPTRDTDHQGLVKEGDDQDDDVLDDDQDDAVLSDDLGDDDAEEDDGAITEDDDDDSPAAPPKKRNKVTARERISELTKRLREAEKTAFEAEMRAIDKQAPADISDDNSASLQEPDSSAFEFGEFDPKYLDALADYRAEVKFRERSKSLTEEQKKERAEAEKARYRTRYETIMGQGSKKYDDFEEVVNTTPFEPALARLVLDSDLAVDISYYLGNNLKALRRITAMTPTDRARAIGRLEGRISASSAVRKKSKAPGTPTQRGSNTKGKESSKYGPANQDDFDKAFYGR